ncbi:flagellar biosynthetic protein FliO [Clostridiaceae bacterium UIB06]|uniref:Flagellar protein n=1 Tax=Clostridium thailandense TaxID=2794346 RepID=A0A949X1I7_9CLOT|nr:flagellar biosynthetic protein FliO [Clostridium thailandense]MBV7272209.1 flagellar biosynthetic protein FliO [Clostridium thailandense]MCH5136506.1 flagellar biosynthetic protein FliO [Clostridiaceae bacterium UIB06]
MDLQFGSEILRTVMALGFILILIYVSMKYGGSKLQDIQKGKYIKILERAPISKENSLLVVKIGQKGYVVASSSGKIEVISELLEGELIEVEASKVLPQYENLKDFYEKTGLKKFQEKIPVKNLCEKLKFKKEDRNE